MNPDNTRRLALEVIARAARDMRDTERRDAPDVQIRIEAVVWLASRAATPWFDLAGIDQLHTLRRARWVTHALAILDVTNLPADTPPLTAAQRTLLRAGIVVATTGKPPQTSAGDPRTHEDAHPLPRGHSDERRGSQA